MVVDVTAKVDGAERIAASLQNVLHALVVDARPMWERMGAKIREHILERWTARASAIPPLAPSTQKARARRWGYYRRAPGSFPFLGRGFWWTGKALERAVGLFAFKALKSSLIYDFGRNDQPRKRLGFMHFGGKGRPARPIYLDSPIQSIAAREAEAYVELVLTQSGLKFQITNAGAQP